MRHPIVTQALKLLACEMRETDVLAAPDAVKDYLRLKLATRPHEVFAVVFLDAQNRVIEFEEMFRGTLTQLSVTLLRKYFGWFRYFTATQSDSQLWSRIPSCLLPPVVEVRRSRSPA